MIKTKDLSVSIKMFYCDTNLNNGDHYNKACSQLFCKPYFCLKPGLHGGGNLRTVVLNKKCPAFECWLKLCYAFSLWELRVLVPSSKMFMLSELFSLIAFVFECLHAWLFA